jgi:predicted RNA-binding protein YlxR (DUF448 family)
VKSEDSGPERTCIVTGREGAPEAMLRFALSGEGVVTPDILRKLPGRGVWTQLDSAIVRQAAQKQAFSRGFRKPVQIGPDIVGDVDRLLEQDALRFLSLVNKAGLVITGAAKVDSAIRAGGLAGLIHACDGSQDGAGKLDRLLLGLLGEKAESTPRINLFTSSQLDLALGRTNVIHAALCAGPASSAFLAKVARLTRYRSGESAPTLASATLGAAVAG